MKEKDWPRPPAGSTVEEERDWYRREYEERLRVNVGLLAENGQLKDRVRRLENG